MKRLKKQCELCNEPFFPKTVMSVYCSKKCSQAAYVLRKSKKEKDEKLKALRGKIPDERQFISVSEAHALFGVARTTLYRLIRQGKIPAVNIGIRLTRIDRKAMEEMFSLIDNPKANDIKPKKKLYSLEKEDCYSIGEIAKLKGVSKGTVYRHIRQYSIPTRQIGKYVFAPKSEIDDLYNGNFSNL